VSQKRHRRERERRKAATIRNFSVGFSSEKGGSNPSYPLGRTIDKKEGKGKEGNCFRNKPVIQRSEERKEKLASLIKRGSRRKGKRKGEKSHLPLRVRPQTRGRRKKRQKGIEKNLSFLPKTQNLKEG